MIRKIGLLALAICLFVALSSPALAQAQSGLTVLKSSTQAEFPSQLSFSLSVKSDAKITDIRLHYTVERVSFAQVVSEASVAFEPATSVEAKWSLDMRKTGGLPPGTNVDYWWTVEDASGDRLETTPVRIQFEDNRYPWQSLTADRVTLYWYEGSKSFAQELMTATQQALSQLAEDTGAHPERPVKLYIYANARDLQGAMIYPQEWAGGVTFDRYDTIAIGIAPGNITWGKGAIAHELTHLIIHQVTLGPYSSLPVWLDEGLATYAEGTAASESRARIEKAIAEDRLISVRSLASPFSAYPEASYLSYAESYSLVEFLLSHYGRDKMLELLGVFRQGSSFDGALTRVYGFDMDGLDTLWRQYITGQSPQSPAGTGVELSPLLVAVFGVPAMAFLLVLALGAKSWARRRGR